MRIVHDVYFTLHDPAPENREALVREGITYLKGHPGYFTRGNSTLLPPFIADSCAQIPAMIQLAALRPSTADSLSSTMALMQFRSRHARACMNCERAAGSAHSVNVHSGSFFAIPPFNADSCARMPLQVMFAAWRAFGNGWRPSRSADTNS
jgi:hypothetical protein